MSTFGSNDDNPLPDRFKFDTTEDIFWFVGLLVGTILTLLSLYTFSLIIQHLYCIETSPQLFITRHVNISPAYSSCYSTLSSTFAIICVILVFTTYPMCTEWHCGYNILGNVYYITVLDTYVSAKLFLYLLFIGRLFNEFYQKIYVYPKLIRVLLLTFISLIVFSTLTVNIVLIFNFRKKTLNFVTILWISAYVLSDFILSIFTLILFFAPIWNSKCNSHSSSNSKMSIIFKYGIISSIQTISGIIYGISLIIRFCIGWYHTDNEIGDSYLDICSLIQMMDMLTTMICIYIGFAKKTVYRPYCEICHECIIKCCFNCCFGYHLQLYDENGNKVWDQQILQQHILQKQNLNLNTTTDIATTGSKSNIQANTGTTTLIVATGTSTYSDINLQQ